MSRRIRRWQREMRHQWRAWRKARHALLVAVLGVLVVVASTFLAGQTARTDFRKAFWRPSTPVVATD